ncbi:MAG: hypothetical protein KGY99_08125 [Phycisphaerae bacterium]|nr:hypothetical protein [Phycisphaerae bacterium]
MYRYVWIAGVLLAAVGCTHSDENPDWDPRADLPAWSYDAPVYYRPTEDLAPVEPGSLGFEVAPNIDVYFVNQAQFFVVHPSGYQVTGEPRMGVWYSLDHERWQRAGYFGVEQSHFLMQAEQDGRYWVRFAGPGQPISEVPPGQPHRIYVVDRQRPQITLDLTPPPYTVDEEGNRIPHTYHVGDEVSLHWRVDERYLEPDSIRLSSCFAEFPHNLVWGEWPRPLEAEGTIEGVVLPAAAGRHGGMRFRMEARDRAGNIGLAMTELMHVEGDDAPSEQPSVRPAGQFEIVYQQPARQETGWPHKGAFVRGGRPRVLTWMPKLAARHADKRIDLEFSANDGRSWHVVAEGITPSEGEQEPSWKVAWTVPEVTSKNCRLRVVARPRGDEGDALMLALSARFTVDTVAPDTMLGPEPVEPGE